MSKTVFIVDDEKEIGTFLEYVLRPKDCRTILCTTGKECITAIEKETPDLAMIDIRLPDTNGLDLLRKLKKAHPGCRTIIMTGYATIDTAVEAIKRGADDFIEKPFSELEVLEAQLDHFLLSKQGHSDELLPKSALKAGAVIGRDKETLQLFKLSQKLAPKRITLMLNGETGTGKEVLARFIHQESGRASAPFIAVNCGALSENLLESELFGHEKGAFTGALSERKGLFESAAHGTLFLDEIAEASPAIQVKLLRVLESKEYVRVGSELPRKTNARIIAATHKNLEEAVKEGSFREDLFYRLHVVNLTLPPLRSRRADLPLVVDHMLEQLQNPPPEISEEALQVLLDHHWPGNLRELGNILTRAVLSIEGETSVIRAYHLQLKQGDVLKQPEEKEEDPPFPDRLRQLTDTLVSLYEDENLPPLQQVLDLSREIEKETGAAFIDKALQQTRGRRTDAAELLQTTPRKMRYIHNEK